MKRLFILFIISTYTFATHKVSLGDQENLDIKINLSEVKDSSIEITYGQILYRQKHKLGDDYKKRIPGYRPDIERYTKQRKILIEIDRSSNKLEGHNQVLAVQANSKEKFDREHNLKIFISEGADDRIVVDRPFWSWGNRTYHVLSQKKNKAISGNTILKRDGVEASVYFKKKSSNAKGK